MMSLTDLTGGILAVAGVIIAAGIGWLGTRNNTNATFAADLIHELREDNKDLRARMDAQELEMEQRAAEHAAEKARYREEVDLLRQHVDKCDADYTEAKQRITQLEKIISGIFEKRDIEDLIRELYNGSEEGV
jgi:uncharacterized protein (DUF3084 family)